MNSSEKTHIVIGLGEAIAKCGDLPLDLQKKRMTDLQKIVKFEKMLKEANYTPSAPLTLRVSEDNKVEITWLKSPSPTGGSIDVTYHDDILKMYNNFMKIEHTIKRIIELRAKRRVVPHLSGYPTLNHLEEYKPTDKTHIVVGLAKAIAIAKWGDLPPEVKKKLMVECMKVVKFEEMLIEANYTPSVTLTLRVNKNTDNIEIVWPLGGNINVTGCKTPRKIYSDFMEYERIRNGLGELSQALFSSNLKSLTPQGWAQLIEKTKRKVITGYPNNCLYIPIMSHGVTFGLGVFKTEEDAEDSIIEFLEFHLKFTPWITGIKERYKKRFDKEFPGLYKSLFDDDFEDFWEEELGCFTIECVQGGTLYDFTHYREGTWVSPPKPENNNLYKIQKAVLYKKCFSTDVDFYASEHPCI